MNDFDTSELKPCPNCKRHDDLRFLVRDIFIQGRLGYYSEEEPYIVCGWCGCSMYGYDEFSLIQKWNKRDFLPEEPLLPCPECGSDDVVIRADKHIPTYAYTHCNHCGFSDVTRCSRSMARREWNELQRS